MSTLETASDDPMRITKENVIMVNWKAKKFETFAFDFELADRNELKYLSLIMDQTKYFRRFLKSLTAHDIDDLYDEVTIEPMDRPLDRSLSCFPDLLDRNDVGGTLAFNRIFHSTVAAITGESIYSHILARMFKLSSLRDASMLSVLDILMAEIGNYQYAKRIQVVISIMSKPSLRELLAVIFHPTYNATLVMLGHKYDQGCSLKVLPRDVVLKICKITIAL